MNLILSDNNNKLIVYANDNKKLTVIIVVAIMIVLSAIILKCNFKVAYKVTFDGKTLGYVQDKNDFICTVTNKVLNQDNKNIDIVVLDQVPQYQLSLINKNKKTDENAIVNTLKLKADVTYKLYAVTLGESDKAYVDTLEEAKAKVSELTEKYGANQEAEFGVREVYTDNIIEYKNMKYATTTKLTKALEEEAVKKAEEEAAKKAEEEAAKKAAQKSKKVSSTASASQKVENVGYIDNVAFSVAPVSGNISSRFGANESIRNHTHKGLDIAAPNGTPIYAAADGVVNYAQFNNGGYGYLVILGHGDGSVETYYGHCSKLYVSKGQTVKAGDLIGAVGSTGYSTGNHLHFEIRKNGAQVNPQIYLYN